MQGEEQLPHQLRKISHKIKELEKLIQTQPERPRESTKAEELFRLIVDNSYDIITLHDSDLNLTYRFVSPSIKKITNYKPEELINKSPWEFIHPEDQQKMMPLLKRYLPPQPKKPFDKQKLSFIKKITYRFKDKKGEWRYFQSSGSIMDNQLLFITRDITKQKQAEEELKLRQKEFASLFKNSPEALIYTDKNFKIINLNPKFTKLFGYTLKEIKGKNMDDLSIIPPDRVEEARTLTKRSFQENISLETVRRDREGRLFPVVISSSRVTVEGEFKGIIVSYRDITTHQKLVESLKKSEKKYRDLFTSIPGGFYRIDNQGKITMMNSEGARMFGYASPEETIGKEQAHIFYFSPEERERYLQELEKNNGFLKDYEITLRKRDGSPVVISDTSHYYYDEEGKIAGIEGTFIDITARKEIEKEIRYEQSLLHALMDNISDSIYFKDREKRFIRVNKKKAENAGLIPEEMMGKTDFDFFSPEAAQSSALDDELVINSGQPIINKEERIIDKNQRENWVSTTKVPWYNQEGKVVGVIGISRDITEYKRNEQIRHVLYNISQAANSPISLDEFYRTIHQELGAIINTTNFYISLVDKEKNQIYFPYSVDETGHIHKERTLEHSSLIVWVIRSGRPLLVTQEMVQKDPQWKSYREWFGKHRQVWLGVPLKISEETIGVMVVQSYTNPNLYVEKDIEIMKFVSFQIARVIEWKRIEEAIKMSQEEFANLFMSNPEALLYLDENARIKNINPRFSQLFGYTLEELKGRYIDEGMIHPPDKIEEGQKMDQIALEKGYVNYQTVRKKKNGTLFPVFISASRMFIGGKMKGIIATYRDLTSQKEIEEKIRQSEEKFAGIFFHIPEAAFYQDIEGTILEINSNFTKLFGYTRADVIGKNIDEIGFYPPNRIEEGKRLTIQSRTENIKNFETIRLKKDGTPVWVSISSSSVKVRGKFLGEIALYQDITERKQNEQLQRVLYHISQAANSTISLNELYQTIHQELGMIIDTTNFHIALLNPERSNIQYVYFVDEKDKISATSEVNSTGTLASYVIKTGQPLLANFDLINEMIERGELIRPNLGTLTPKTVWLGVPLKVGDKIMGSIAVLSYTNPHLYSQKDIQILEFVSTQVAMAIERKQIEDRIKYLSFHDSLTGVYNRAYLEEELKRYNFSRYYPLSLVMIDVNGLKVVNDTFGHAEGDRLLQHLTQILRSICRKGDILARIGGDEFAIILPSTNSKEACCFCERIEKACQEDKIKPEYLRINLSLGQVTQQGEYKDLSSLFKEVDRRMYQNKLLNDQKREAHFLEIFRNILTDKDPHIIGEFPRIQRLAISLGEKAGLSEYQLKNLKILALFHDLGKINIPKSLLFKHQDLTSSEGKMIKKHPIFGYRIATNFSSLDPIAQEILYHHEHWNGSGYPEGLQGEQIPLLSRIISLVNTYDVMQFSCPSQQAKSKEEALKEIRRRAGTQFDPLLVDIFLKMMGKES